MNVLSFMRGQEQYIKEKPLEDGRLSFATDSKKIYLDCDYTDPHNNKYQDRISFGGNSGIYYGNRTFTTEEIEENDYSFNFPDDFDNSDEIPSVDDIIINTDGCFYRVLEIDENNYITVNKLTVAGGGGGGLASGIIVAKDPNQDYNIIAAKHSIPIGFKVTDTIENTTIDVEVIINDVRAGVFRAVEQDIYTSIDLYRYLSYFTINNVNTVRLRFTNEYDHAATLTLTNIRIVNLEVRIPASLGVISTSTANLAIQPFGASTMYERYLNISVKIPGYLNPTIEKLPFSSIIDNGETYVYAIDLSNSIEGNYTVDVWLSALASEGDTEELTSPVVTTSFIYRDANSNVPMLSANLGQSIFNQYDIAVIDYMVAYEGTNITVQLQAYCNNELVESQRATVSFNTSHHWNVALVNSGIYKFVISIEEYDLIQTIDNITVNALEVELPEIDTTDNSLQLYLNAAGRSNNEARPDVWVSKTTECKFENFNWNTNGWLTDDNYTTSLHLSNGAKLTVPFAIFSAENTENKGAHITGKTIEINFKLSNVRDVNAIIINAASWWNNKISVGIVGTGDKICMNTSALTNYHTPEEDMALSDSEKAATNGLRAYIAEDERVHVAFAINPIKTYMNPERPNEVLDTYGLIYTYVNGVLSGLTKYSNEAIIDAADSAKSEFIFDSTNADIDIYSIRVYSKYCEDSILLNNYAADLPTIEDRLFVKNNNDVLVGGEISLNKVRNLGNIPYLVITDLRKTGDKKGNLLDSDGNIVGYGPDTSSSANLTNGKKDFRWAPCYYVDPEHPDRNFGDPNNLIDAVIYGQGTSSLAYPVKNFRLRFCKKADKYSLLPAIPGIDNDSIEKAKWENVPKVALFTIKADYMDSSMSHNIGTGNALAGLYDSIALKSPAQLQYPDKTLSTNIVGRPIIVFWRPGEIGTETYIGRYNFNTDKAEHSLFGFESEEDGFFGRLTKTVNGETQYKWGFQSTTDESDNWDSKELYNKIYYTAPNLNSTWEYNGIQDGGKAMKTALGQGPLYEYVEGPRTIQCWEFLNNGAALDGFRKGWDGDLNEWVAAFESRYPEHQETKVDANNKYQFCSDNRGFARLINWLHSTDQSQATNNDLENPISYSNITYTQDTKEYRLAKFINEFDNYMNKNFTIFYYIMTEVLLMIDSRAKNMMMCSYDLDCDAGTGHWFPIFYDMDTILGVDNSGVLRYSYNIDDAVETVYNASANYGMYDANNNWQANPNYSVLWCNLREGFQTDIKSMYNNLRSKKLTLEYLLSSYNEQEADAWAEIYDNKDGWYKYIRPLTEVTTVTVDGRDETRAGINWIHAEQGTRSMHREYFLKHRFTYLDSKYATGTNGTEDIYLRVNVPLVGVKEHPDPHPLQFNLTSQGDQYGVTKFGGNGILTSVYLPANTTVQTPMPTGVDTAKDVETYIFNIGDIYDIGDLSDKFLTSIEFKRQNKLRYLRFGNADPSYLSSEATAISGLSNVNLLEVFDLQNAKLSSTALDLSNQKYFKELYAKGSNLTQVSFAEGCNLQHVELPTSITEIILKNILFYDTINHPENLIIQGYNNIEHINISGCPLVNTYSLMNTIMLQDSSENGQITRMRLPDVNWIIDDINDDTVIFDDDNSNIIKDIKILSYIERIPGGYTVNGSPVSKQQTNNEYFGGTITINNGDYFIDDLALKNKYSAKFPYLNFVYTNPNNIIAGYNINVYTAQNEINRIDSKIISHSEAIGFNLKSFLQNEVHIPSVPNSTSAQWTYEFKGWTYDQSISSNNLDVIANALNNGISIEYDEINDIYIVDTNCPTALTENNYINHQLSLYPVFQMHLRKYNITFYKTEQNVTPVEIYTTIEQEYGSRIMLPDMLPAKFELNQNDKSISRVQYLNTYVAYNGVDYSNLLVENNIELYPVYSSTWQSMDNITNPPTYYFDTSTHKTVQMFDRTFIDDDGNKVEFSDTDNNTIEAIIKENVRAEAVCVPKKIDNKYVISIKNRSPYIKRVYFEPGSVIKYIGGADAGFNGSQFTPGNTGDKYRYEDGIYIPDENGTYVRIFKGFIENNVNTVLEYIDLKALTQLEVLGGNDSQYTGEDTISRVFANCPNLDIQDLPDSLTIINPYTFFKDSNLTIEHMPKDLLCIGNYAFQQCTSLGEIIFGLDFDQTRISDYNENSNLQAKWPIIGNYAFYQCTNLLFQTKNPQTGIIINDTSLTNIATIGEYAFFKCSNFVMTLSSISNTSIKYIGQYAFADCTNLGITKIPQAEHIGTRAYQNIGILPILSAIPNTIKYIGEAVFNGDTLASNNGDNLIWTFYPTVAFAETNDIIINAQALKGCNIQKLTFNFDTYSAADPEDFIVIKEKMPWSTAYTNENYGFGANVSKIQILANNIYID